MSVTPNIITKERGSAFMHVLGHSSMKERPPLLAASTCKIFESGQSIHLFMQPHNIAKYIFKIHQLSRSCVHAVIS